MMVTMSKNYAKKTVLIRLDQNAWIKENNDPINLSKLLRDSLDEYIEIKESFGKVKFRDFDIDGD